MALIVNSPYSGRPVKVREEDVGRAVRDGEGRVFYLLRTGDGKGYYASPTRVGGGREEEAYRRLAPEAAAGTAPGGAGQADGEPRVYNAAGKGLSGIARLNLRRWLPWFILLDTIVFVVIVLWALHLGPFAARSLRQTRPTPATAPVVPATRP